jgi:glycerol-3-phosphate dehydrogenase (NAD(P)+)
MARREEQADYMRKRRVNPDYLRVLELPSALRYEAYREADFREIDLLVLAVPSKHYRSAIAAIADSLPIGIRILSLTKGLDPLTGARLSELLQDQLGHLNPSIAVLSGPNHAEEVALRQPTATVISSIDLDYARLLQTAISNESFRAYVNADVTGVELAGVVKNVVALATGMSDGLGYGDNARAALITRGLAEMSRFGQAHNADPRTFAGLAGLGDLVATCTSEHSRNRLAGDLLAQGHSPDELEAEMHMVAEGLAAAPLVLSRAKALGIEMPITENVVAVVEGGKDPRDCVSDLMSRQPREED